MNTQTIRDELSQFIYSNFDAQDMDILNELSEIFVQSHSCQFPIDGEQPMDGVRHLTKYATDVNQKFFKSYTSGRDKHTAIWSKNVYTVQGSKQKNRMKQYQLSNNKWYYPFELQKIEYGVQKMTVDIPKKKRAPPKKKKVTFSGDPVSNVWSELSPENVIEKEIIKDQPRRSTRIRRKPDRFSKWI